MKVWKKILAPVLAAAVILVPAACGSGNDADPGDVVGGDWRVTGIVRDSGTITRGGEDTDVLVCINADSADFYYDSEDQTLYGYASYPTTLPCDPWEAFRSIDFADRNGDGDSDAALLFEVDGSRVLLVWYWDGGSDAFVFQPEESQIGGDDNGAAGEFLTDEDFDADISAWQGDDGSQLLLDLPNGCYTYRTWYGRVGTGSLVRDGDNLVLSFGDLTGENDYCLIREGRGFRPVLLSGQEGGAWAGLNGLHFGPAQGEAAAFDSNVLDGVWQNALGYALAFDIQRMRVVACDINDTMDSGALYDKMDGRGLFMGGAEILYPCVSADGSSFVLFADGGVPRELDSRSTGVFYRNGDAAAYSDPANAGYEESDGRIWYYDGVNYFAVPAGYTLGEDGQARNEDGRPFASPWPGELYDPAAVWGENWMNG